MLPLWIRLINLGFIMVVMAVNSWLCLFRTRQLQRWVAELSRDWKYMARPDEIESTAWLWETRFFGFVTAISTLFMGYLFIRLLVRR